MVKEHSSLVSLRDTIEDGCRFVLYNRAIIETAPLQLYVSGLLFAHSSSIIGSYFTNDKPDWIRLSTETEPGVRSMASDWGLCEQTLEGHTGAVNCVVFAHNHLASASADKTVKFWSLPTGALIRTLHGHVEPVTALAFSVDGKCLASASHDGRLVLWDLSTGVSAWDIQAHEEEVTSLVCFLDNARLASASGDGTVKIWDISTGFSLFSRDHGIWINSIHLSADNSQLAIASDGEDVEIFDTTTWHRLQSFPRTEIDPATSVSLSPNGRLFAFPSSTSVFVQDLASNVLCTKLQNHKGDSEILSVAFSPDSKHLAASSTDDIVRLWDVATGVCLLTFEGHRKSVNSLVFSTGQGQEKLITSSDDKTIKVWDITRREHKELMDRSERVELVVIATNGQRFASAAGDTIKIWNAVNVSVLRVFYENTDTVDAIGLSSDGKLLSSNSADFRITIRDIDTGHMVSILRGHSWHIKALVFYADSKRLASCSEDTTVRIWDVASGGCLHSLRSHVFSVDSIALSSDGELLASASGDEEVKIWDTASGACVKTFNPDKTGVKAVALSAETGVVATLSSTRGSMKIWDCSTDAYTCLQTLSVGELIGHMRFVGSRLCTNVGAFDVILEEDDSLQGTRRVHIRRSGLGISSDSSWILDDERCIVWLPSSCRPTASDIAGSTIVLGCTSGRVITLQIGA